jgi:hypothetical protein
MVTSSKEDTPFMNPKSQYTTIAMQATALLQMMESTTAVLLAMYLSADLRLPNPDCPGK